MNLLAGRPADGAALAGPIVCACFSVGRDALVDAIVSQKATDVNAIGRLLRAGTNCGSCIPEINGLLDRHALGDVADHVAQQRPVGSPLDEIGQCENGPGGHRLDLR
jgi:NAD(P)H-nitrite reductase large subunit